jgi:hypothetical protein
LARATPTPQGSHGPSSQTSGLGLHLKVPPVQPSASTAGSAMGRIDHRYDSFLPERSQFRRWPEPFAFRRVHSVNICPWLVHSFGPGRLAARRIVDGSLQTAGIRDTRALCERSRVRPSPVASLGFVNFGATNENCR